MTRLASQTVTDAEFEALVAGLANPVITADQAFKYVTVGARQYRAPLATRAVPA